MFEGLIHFCTLSFQIASTALFPPSGVLVLSILGFAWIVIRGELRTLQIASFLLTIRRDNLHHLGQEYIRDLLCTPAWV